MAKKAQLAPTQAWVQTSLAWTSHVAGNFDQALELVEQAQILDPGDSHNRDFWSLIIGLNGEFKKAIALVKPHLDQANSSEYIIHRNIYAMANFHLGNYRGTIKYINQILETGGAINPLLTTYLAVSYQSLAEHEKAKNMLIKQRKSWPDFQPEIFLTRLFRYKMHADQVINKLREIE